MANEVKVKQGTSVVWKNSGGDHVLTLTSMATVTGRKGDVHDWGATFPALVRVQLQTQFGTGPTAGQLVELYWVSSVDNTTFDANTAGGDGAFTDTDLNKHLHPIGSLPADNATSVQVKSWLFKLPARYGYPVVYNATGQSLGSTAGNHILTMTPILDEIQ